MTDTPSDAAATSSSQPQVSTLSKRWALKTGIGALVCLGVGVWGYVDATIIYPKRGYRAAEQLEQSYLEAVDKTARGLDGASVPDPVAKFAELEKSQTDGGKLSTPDEALRLWLDALQTVRKLAPANTTYPRTDFRTAQPIATAAARLDALKKSTESRAAPLSKWDIPTQWLIMVVFTLVGAWLLWLYLRVAGRKYRWDPSAQRLTLPDGNALVPADIAEFDKRKWDKFMVTLLIKPSHATLANQGVLIDLYRHEPVEEWVLEMERTAFPESAAEKSEGESAPGAASGEAPTPPASGA